MNLTALSFRYRRLVLLLLTAALVYGGAAYFTLPAREDPEITIREALVTTRFPGLAPERVEQLITKTLEEAARQVPEVEEIRSSSLTGLSILHVVVYDRFFELDAIWEDLRAKIDRASARLPDGSGEPDVDTDFGDVAALTLALTAADGFSQNAVLDVAESVRDHLYSVEGTKKVQLFGVQEERIYLRADNSKLARFGLNPQQVIGFLREQNVILPGGEIDTGAQSFIIEPSGNFGSLDAIRQTLIMLPDGETLVPLQDLMTVSRETVDPPQQPAYFNRERAVVFAVSMLSGYNVLEYSPRLKTRIAEIETTLPVGYRLSIATYQADQVAQTVNGVSLNVLQTLAIVLGVVILFLGVRTGLIVGAVVPCVMLVTLAVMKVAGIDLERMSLATLIISLGLLVDNGIVIAEDYKRRLEAGVERERALREGGGELALPLLTSSLTTILVFLPLMLAEHVAGEYTRSVSLVILIALLSSWLLALCVTPTLCYYFIKTPPQGRRREVAPGHPSPDDDPAYRGRVYRVYRGLLKGLLAYRLSFLAAMAALLVGAVLLMRLVPDQFFPDSDRAQVLVYLDLPAGTSMRTTDRTLRRVLAWLDDAERFPYIDSYAGYGGFGGPRFVLSLTPVDPADNKAFVVINVSDLRRTDEAIETLRRGFAKEFPTLSARVKRMFLGPSESGIVAVRLIGPDADVLYRNAREVERLLNGIDGTLDVRQDWENRIIKLAIQVDQQRARRAGVSSEDIALSLQRHFDGARVTPFREQDEIIPILWQAEDDERFDLDRLRSLSVFSQSRNVSVPLLQIADFEPVNQYARIERRNLFRTITVEGKHRYLTAKALEQRLLPELEKIGAALPVNHRWEFGGVTEQSAEAGAALSANLPLCLALIVVLLVAQFNSYRKPLIIVLTIPLALIGAAVGLLLTGSFFGFMVNLGLYSLAGIIINNAIVLIDRIGLERERHDTLQQAIIVASVQRLRPIVITTITTICGLLPLIIARDPLFYGMANAIAFGLGVGTVLTLGVVPVLYSLFYNRGEHSRNRDLSG